MSVLCLFLELIASEKRLDAVDSILKLNSRSRNERLITYYLAANPCREEKGALPDVPLIVLLT